MKTMSLIGTHVLRCVHCGTVQDKIDRLFRCSECSELLEVIYPDWGAATPESSARLKKLWQERRLSTAAEDVSGWWGYRELLPRLQPHNIVTITEGNPPVLSSNEAAPPPRPP